MAANAIATVNELKEDHGLTVATDTGNENRGNEFASGLLVPKVMRQKTRTNEEPKVTEFVDLISDAESSRSLKKMR